MNQLTTADADRLLGLADQFLEDWEKNEGKNDPECKERRQEYDAIRPLLVAAPDMLAALQEIEAQLAVHPDADKGNSKVHYCLCKARGAISETKAKAARNKDDLIKQQGWYAHSGTTCKRCGMAHGPWQTLDGSQEFWGCVQCGSGVACGGDNQPTADEAADIYMGLVK